MAKATPGTATFQGKTYQVSTSMEFASFYRCTFRDQDQPMIRFHKTEKAAQRGTWDSPAMRESWAYLGYVKVER